MVVCWEVDRGKRHIAEETGRGAFVEADETQIPYDPHCASSGGALNGFRNFALHLKTDFDDFERIGKDLSRVRKGLS